MNFIVTVQKNGMLYITTDGELWGHGIEIEPHVWNCLDAEEKEIVYGDYFDARMEELYASFR